MGLHLYRYTCASCIQKILKKSKHAMPISMATFWCVCVSMSVSMSMSTSISASLYFGFKFSLIISPSVQCLHPCLWIRKCLRLRLCLCLSHCLCFCIPHSPYHFHLFGNVSVCGYVCGSVYVYGILICLCIWCYCLCLCIPDPLYHLHLSSCLYRVAETHMMP